MTTLISYAQNFEDVMLWRALKHVENGFYIDLGAQDPLIDSVSLAFHERGWTGIHVEPTPHYAQLLRAQRAGDTVIEAAVGNDGDILTFFEIPDTGISTADPQIAQQHREKGFEIREITVPCVRLSSIFKTCGKQEIHWMKIDVEGFEWSALTSWGRAASRPWIVVVESTLPLTQIESYQRWEPLLIRRGYTPVYFDGLNRYYVSKERAELKQAFYAPPNVFDGFSVSGTASTTVHHHLMARHATALAEVRAEMQSVANEVVNTRQTLTANEVTLERERQVHLVQLDQQRQEILLLVRAQAQREEAFSTRSAELGLQKEELIRQLFDIEREAARKFVECKQKADEELEQHNHRYFERERELELRLSALQEEYAGQLEDLRKQLNVELARAVRDTNALGERWADRERELGVQLLAVRQELDQKLATAHVESAAENNRLISEYAEQLLSLKQKEAERELDALAQDQASTRKMDLLRQQTEADRARLIHLHEVEISKLKESLQFHEREFSAQLESRQQASVTLTRVLEEQVQSGHKEALQLTKLMVAREQELGAQLLASQSYLAELQLTMTARERELEFGLKDVNRDAAALERAMRDIEKEFLAASTELMTIKGSAFWKVFAPLRRLLSINK